MIRQFVIRKSGLLLALGSRAPGAIDLRKFGPVSVSRTTDVRFHEGVQKYYAVFQDGEFVNCPLTHNIAFTIAGVPTDAITYWGEGGGGTLYFHEETECIRAEHLVVEALRRKGKMINSKPAAA